MRLSIEKSNIGLVIIVFSILLFIAGYAVTDNLMKANSVAHLGCNLPEGVCPFSPGIPANTAVMLTIDILLGIFGLTVFLSGRKEKEIPLEDKERREKIIKSLNTEEQDLFYKISESGTIFQSELVEKSSMSKVKITRILDKLESKGLVERRRRGMTNVIVLKN